jgi:restriction system protein
MGNSDIYPSDLDSAMGRSLPLEEWLEKALAQEQDEWLINYEFQTDGHADEYLSTIASRSEKTVIALLRKFLFPACCFPQSEAARLKYLEWQSRERAPDQSDSERLFPWKDLLEFEYNRWLLLSKFSKGQIPSWEGIRWVLDLLPHFPRQAIDAINAYILAHAQILPDGRYRGLAEAAEVIRAKYIQSVPGDAREALLSLTPREFEHVVERLFSEMGYKTTLTKTTRDGGRDIIAIREQPGFREKALVECKLYDKSELGYEQVMKLLGVVSNEPASRGVIVTTGHVTQGAEKASPRIEVIGLERLGQLMNEYLGPKWPYHLRGYPVTPNYRKLLLS